MAPSTPSTSSPASSLTFSEADTEENDFLEGLCRNEFGLKLGKLRASLHSQAKEQQSALLRFCADVRLTEDADRRRDIAKTFITDLATISELATERFMRMLVKMQATFLANVQMQNKALIRSISMFENEVEELKSALGRAEMEKARIEAESERKFEEDKAVFEVKLREELHACQICLQNPRNTVIMPCLHAHFCGDCLEAIQKNNRHCPTCRGLIRGTVPYIA